MRRGRVKRVLGIRYPARHEGNTLIFNCTSTTAARERDPLERPLVVGRVEMVPTNGR